MRGGRPVPPRNGFCGTCDFDKTLEFIRLFSSGEPQGALRAWLNVEVPTPDPQDPLFAAIGVNIFTTPELQAVEFDSQRVEANQLSPFIGYLLVRPVPVPEPATAAMLVSGLLALSQLRRRRRAVFPVRANRKSD